MKNLFTFLLMAVLAMGYATAQTVLFTETFDKCEGTGGNDGKWSGSIVTKNTLKYDGTAWSVTNGYAASKCAKFGTSSKQGSATTPAIDFKGSTSGTLTFKAGAWQDDATTLKISADNAKLSSPTVTMKNSAFTTYSIDITDVKGVVKITFSGNKTSKARFFLDSVVVSTAQSKADAGLSFSASTAAAYMGLDFSEPTLNNPNSLDVTYKSSNTSVASVDASTGEVTLVGTGTTTITASSAETDTYAAGSASYTLTVSKQESGLSFNPTEETITVDGPFTAPTFSNAKGIAVKFSSSNTSVATVDDKGNITFNGVAGTATITATPGDPNYSGDATFTLTVSKLTPTLEWDKDAVTATKGKAFKAPRLLNPSRLNVTYSSSNTAVATINSRGILAVAGAGTTTITAASAESDRYSAASDSYTLTVVSPSGSGVPTSGTFTLVEDPSTLAVGTYFIVASISNDKVNYVMGTPSGSSTQSFAPLEKGESTYQVSDDQSTITVPEGSTASVLWLKEEGSTSGTYHIYGNIDKGKYNYPMSFQQGNIYCRQSSKDINTDITLSKVDETYNNGGKSYTETNVAKICASNLTTCELMYYQDRFGNFSRKNLTNQGSTTYPVRVYAYNSVPVSTEINLADLAFNSEGTFTITGQDMQAVTTVQDKANSKYYVAVKDGNGLSNDYVSKNDGLNTYYHNGKEWENYDQSNWVLVEVSASDYSSFNPAAVTKIVGTYNGDANDPIITDATITYGDATADDSKYTPNEYIPVNFMTVKQADYWGNSQKANQGDYFFMNPKAQEYAKVAWAVWDASSQAFYVAKSADGANKYDFDGMFTIALDYNEGDVRATSQLTDQAMYAFPAIVKKQAATSSTAPRKVAAKTGSTQSEYVVYPLEINASSVVTAVSDVHSAKTVERVSYYNVAGARIAAPQPGVNIVVTTYTDGTTRATKLLK